MRTALLLLLLGIPAGAEVPLVGEALPPDRRFSVSLVTDKAEYAVGELMQVAIRSQRSGYVLLYYIDSTGQALVAVPSRFSEYDRVYAGQSLQVRDNGGRLLEQKGPSGEETLQVLVTRERIQLAALPAVQSDGRVLDPAAFIAGLEQELQRRGQGGGAGPVYGSATVRYRVR